jgi:hypothetical protein
MHNVFFLIGKVELFELVKGLGKKTQHSSLKKQISRVEKREKVLDVPLPRHQLEQVVLSAEPRTKLKFRECDSVW